MKVLIILAMGTVIYQTQIIIQILTYIIINMAHAYSSKRKQTRTNVGGR
ncbi:hypothetical protein HMPREF0454_01652 [Hafnia alvei ATCC 51873]|uniref:Uncharacterized protein n=1 Tax=Hafnia alvei ATCC 51873 TaxID=1002364 RepID=G9Y514_HAFAL|nr:hypothetical protein HMPREF0454_01652 [Hafnia alvei ATCC 51873]